ncbi:MAG TPA: Ig-like domain-containing protein [Gemmatimonadales bacterium]|nr:Ig-like domain-containing protein [Gemmatimonadales bacterium]
MRSASLLIVVLLAACDSPFRPPPPTTGGSTGLAKTLTLRPDSAQLYVDDTLRLFVSVRDAHGQLLVTPVTWSVDDSQVVTVDSNGLAIAVDSGTTMVRATSQGLQDSTTLRVASVAYQSVASGGRHSCAIGINQRIYCWGSDDNGQLGVVPAVLERPAPTGIAAGAVFAFLAAGDAHTCATGTDRLMRCWGNNDHGQLGLGSQGGTGLPTSVVAPFDFFEVAAGGNHTCASTINQTVVCWGSNASGELGLGDTVTTPTPTAVAGGLVFPGAVAAGDAHTCATTANGTAYCWGRNDFGQLGDSQTIRQTLPDSVHGFGFDLLAAGGDHTCGVSSAVAWCWGANDRGQSGTGLPDSAVLVPTLVAGSLNIETVTAGRAFTCGVTDTGDAYCWGANDRGQLGDSTRTDRSQPTLVKGGLHFQSLAAGDQHVCGVTVDGLIYCWGDGTSGQLGVSPPQSMSAFPIRIPLPN